MAGYPLMWPFLPSDSELLTNRDPVSCVLASPTESTMSGTHGARYLFIFSKAP